MLLVRGHTVASITGKQKKDQARRLAVIRGRGSPEGRYSSPFLPELQPRPA
jgi:hypothetical protein